MRVGKPTGSVKVGVTVGVSLVCGPSRATWVAQRGVRGDLQVAVARLAGFC